MRRRRIDSAVSGCDFAPVYDTENPRCQIIGAVIAGGASLLGSVIGGNSQKKAARYQAQVSRENLAFEREKFNYAKERAEVKPIDPENTFRVFDSNSETVKWAALSGDDIKEFALTPDKSYADEIAEAQAVEGAIKSAAIRAPTGNAAFIPVATGGGTAGKVVAALLGLGGLYFIFRKKGV